LLHRLKTLDLDAIPTHVDLEIFQAHDYFEEHSKVLTLVNVMGWQLETLARELRQLVIARDEHDLASLKYFIQADRDRKEAAHRAPRPAPRAVGTAPPSGTPLVQEKAGRGRPVAGYYAASIDSVVTRRDRFATYLRERFAAAGGGDEAAFERFV